MQLSALLDFWNLQLVGVMAGTAVALAMGAHWICNFCVGQLFLQAVDALGVAGVYAFFAGVCACAVLYVSKAVVETKGRSLKDIELAMNS
jgi:hypothetical protein